MFPRYLSLRPKLTPHLPHSLKVLCERCAELCNGAMIPAVQDFTQRLAMQQQQQLSLTLPSTSFGMPGPSGEAAGDGAELQIELLGKALISPEQLRTQLMVRGRGRTRSIRNSTQGGRTLLWLSPLTPDYGGHWILPCAAQAASFWSGVT